MLLRPSVDDVRVIVRVVGLSLVGIGSGTALLAAVALAMGDANSASALGLGAATGLGLGTWARREVFTRRPLSWTRGVVSATASWITCSVVAAIPLYLSRHYASYLDAVFEAMSGLTTTGLTLVQDLDHMAPSMVLYRHGLELGGGMAIVVVGLTVLTAVTATASSLAPSDVRDERILPNPERTWRQVGEVAAVIVGIGVVLCTLAVSVAGVSGWRALQHGVGLAITASTTGGFAGTSMSVGYFHSPVVEFVLVPLMLAGAVSFALHRSAWLGERWRLHREIEVRVLLLSLGAVMALVVVGLARSASHTDLVPLLRRGVFTSVAAHTTTGLFVVTPRLIATDWGLLAPAALVAAMTIGGTSGSTAGGLKALRIGVIARGVITDVRRVLLPESALHAPTFTWGRRMPLRHAHVRAAATLLLVMLTAILSVTVLVLYVDGSVDLTEALFVAASAASNAGQSLGTFGPGDPSTLKIAFLALMLLGRLEWMAVFATIGFAFSGLRGRA